MATPAEIKEVQQALGITADGKAGPQTKAAVQKYQKEKGLKVDGIIGAQTLSAVRGGATPAPAAGGNTVNGVDTINEQLLASQYGFAYNFLKSNPELSKIFSDAVAGGWDAARFTAVLKNSTWYKNSNQSMRSALLQEANDPATYGQKIAQAKQQIQFLARQAGAQITADKLDDLAKMSYMQGWDSYQINDALQKYVDFSDGHMTGQAGQFETQIRSSLAQQGVRVTDDTIKSWVLRSMEQGSTNEAQTRIADMAASAFPAVSDRLRGGETMADITSAYRSSMARILEINEPDVFDQDIQKAMTYQNAEGKQSMKSIWEFERDLRKDARWLQTDNARDSAMSTTRSLLQTFGLAW